MNRETVMTPFLRSTLASLGILVCAAASEARAQQDPFALTPTLTGQAVFSCNDLMVNGNTDSAGPAGSATNQGHVLTNGKITVNSNAKVDGNATAGPGKPTPAPSGNGQITGTRSVASATTPCTPINLTTLTTTLQAQNDNSRVPAGYLNGTQFTVNSGTVTLPAGTYYFTQLTLNGSAQLAVSGLVKILVNGNLNLNSSMNAGTSADPALLRLYTTSSNLNFNSGTTKAYVYAPNANANVNSTVVGGLFAKSATLNGQGRVTRWLGPTNDPPPPCAAPVVALTLPASGSTVLSRIVTLSGTATNTTTLRINGLAATLVNDTFTLPSFDLGAGEGSKTLTLAAVGPCGSTTTTATLEYTTDPFRVSADLAGQAVFSCERFSANGSSIVDSSGVSNGSGSPNQGHVISNDVIDINGNVQIKGDARPGPGKTVQKNGNAQVLGVTTPLTAARNCNPIDLAVLQQTLATTNSNASIGKTTKNKDALQGTPKTIFRLNGNDSITLPAGTYYFSEIDINGQSTVNVSGEVRILCTGAITVNGTSKLNAGSGANPYNLKLYSRGSSVSINGGSEIRAIVYAPQAQATLNGGDVLTGTLFARRVDLNGTAKITRKVDDVAALAIAITESGQNLADGALFGRNATIAFSATGGMPPLSVTATLDGSAFASGSLVSAEGTHRIVVTAVDVAGRRLDDARTFTIDKTGPQLTVVSPAPGSFAGAATIDVSGSAGDALNVTVNGVAATVSGGTYVARNIPLAEGANTLNVSGVDRAGNTASITATVVRDTTTPALALTAPASGTITKNATIAVSGTVSDANLLSLTVNGTAVTPAGGAFSTTVSLTEGSNTILVIARDRAGLETPRSVTVTRDSTPPALRVEEGGALLVDGRVFNRDVAPSVVVTEANPDTLTITLNGTPFAQGTTVSAETTHTLAATATDRAGNTSSTSVSFRIDKTAPAVVITTPATGSVVGSLPQAVLGTAGDAVSVTINGTPAELLGGGSFRIQAFPFTEGQAILSAIATDAAGNTGTASATVLVDTQAPQVVVATPAAGALLGPGPIFVTGTATDSSLESVTVDGLPAQLTGDAFRAGPFSKADGAVTFTVIATDRANRTTNVSRSVTVDTTPPVLTVTNTATGQPVAEGAFFRAAVSLTVTAADATTQAQTTKTVTLDGVTYAGAPVTGEGSHRLDATATDGAGNTSTLSLTFTLDSTPPAFSDLLPVAGTVTATSPVTISGRVSADAEEVTVNGAPATLAGGAFSRAGVVLTEGPNDVPLAARDRAGNTTSQTLRLVLDTTQPTVAITAPAANALLGSATVTVAGNVSDANLDSATGVTVEGGAATVTGGAFQRTGVPLQEGANTLTATATDKAGNTASASVSVRVDTQAPTLVLSAPAAGALLGASPVTVTGTATDANLTGVTVNGVAATVGPTGAFTVQVPLTEGANTLTAIATDALNRTTTVTRGVTLDTAAPVVTITSPAAGARVRTTPQTITGTVDSATGIDTITVNGVTATLTGTTFSASVPLLSGSNAITARARKTNGKEGTAGITLVLDTVAPVLASSVPAEGQTGVSLTPEIRLTFGEELDPATVVPSAFDLRTSGGAVPVVVSVTGPVVVIQPAAALLDGQPYTLTLATSVEDLAGNALAAPLVLHFTTDDQTAPGAPVLDALPSTLFCAPSVTLAGTTEALAVVTVTGGSAVAQATAGANGRFSVTVALLHDTNQTLTVVSRDTAGNTSAAATVSVTTDCTVPRVLDAVRMGNTVVVTFDEPLLSASVRAGDTVRLDQTSPASPITATSTLSGDGRTVTLTASGVDLATVAFTVSVSSGVTDRAGNAVAPFVRSFAPDSVSSLLVGEAFDDAIGRPLAGVTATLLVSGGAATAEPRPFTTVTASGTFTLPAGGGDALVRLSKPGYLDVYRRESVLVGGSGTPLSVTLFDARLTPVAGPATSAPSGGATVWSTPFGARAARIEAAPSALPAATVVRLTPRRAQGLAVLSPLGWSVAAAANASFKDAAGLGVTPTGPVTFVLPDLFGGSGSTPYTLARLDATSLQWIHEGTATFESAEGGRLRFTVSNGAQAAGDWAVFVPDPAPTAPPATTLGSPLTGVSLPAEDPLQAATVVASPVDVVPSQTADVSLTVTTPTPVPSGFPIQTLINEDLTLLDNSHVSAPSVLADLVLMRRGDGSLGLTTPVRASEGAQRVALSVGYERFTVKKFPFEVRRGSIVGSSGGTVTGNSGWGLTLPNGAVATSTSVALTPLTASDLALPIPAGFTLVGAVHVSTGGAAFTLPAALALLTQTPPPAGRDLILVGFESREGFVFLRTLARATYDSGTQTVRSSPIDPAQFPWPGVRGDGTYAFLASTDPLAYVSGRVLDVGSQPLGGALVSMSGWPLLAVTETNGSFALAIRAATGTLVSVNTLTGNAGSLTVTPSAQGQELRGIDLALSVTAPYVVSVSPASGSTVLGSSSFTVNFSEGIDALSLTSSTFVLIALVDGQSISVPGRIDVDSSGGSATFIPEGNLPSNTPLTLGVSRTVRDRNGYTLVDRVTRQGADFAATYTTEDLTPPDSKPYLVRISVPSGSPSSVTITGAPGAVCGGCHVTAYNDTTLATSATNALSDGSFTLTLLAVATDSIRIVVEKPNGTKQTVANVPFTSDGGKTVLVGARGGTWETPEGFRITVPAGALAADGGTVSVKTERLARPGLDALVTHPRDMVYLDSFRMEFPVRATSGFDMSFPAPASQLTDQFFLAQVVEVFGQKRLMVVDILKKVGDRVRTDRTGEVVRQMARQGYVTLVDSSAFRPGPGGSLRLITVPESYATAPNTDDPASYWDGVIEEGVYSLYNSAAVMSYIVGFTGSGATFATTSDSDFVFAGDHLLTPSNFRLIVRPGSSFNLHLMSLTTGLTLFQGTFTSPTAGGVVTVLNPPIGADHEGPGLVLAEPSTVLRFVAAERRPTSPDLVLREAQVGAAIRSIKAASGSGSPGTPFTVTVTGDAGTTSDGAIVRLYNFSRSAGPGVTVAAQTVAAPSGFSLALTGVRAGDRLGVVIENTSAGSTPFRIKFDEFLKDPTPPQPPGSTTIVRADWKQFVNVALRAGSPSSCDSKPTTPWPTGGAPMPVAFDVVGVLEQGGVRELQIVPGAPSQPAQPAPPAAPITYPIDKYGYLKTGCKYTVTLSSQLTDSAAQPNRLSTDVSFDFSSSEPAAAGSGESIYPIRKILYHGGLLIQTGDEGKIRMWDAGNPANLGKPAFECDNGPGTMGADKGLDLPGVGRDLVVDKFGRLICVGGGIADGSGHTRSAGFVKMYEFEQMTPPRGPCSVRLKPRGSAVVSSEIGTDNLTFPPAGTPRRISLYQPSKDARWLVDRDDLGGSVPGNPQVAVQGTRSAGRQRYRAPYSVTINLAALDPDLRGTFQWWFALTNLTTGEVSRGHYPVPPDSPPTPAVRPTGTQVLGLDTVSSGDRLQLEISQISIGVVDVLGYGLGIVDLNSVYNANDTGIFDLDDPNIHSKLLQAYDGNDAPSPSLPGGPQACVAVPEGMFTPGAPGATPAFPPPNALANGGLGSILDPFAALPQRDPSWSKCDYRQEIKLPAGSISTLTAPSSIGKEARATQRCVPSDPVRTEPFCRLNAAFNYNSVSKRYDFLVNDLLSLTGVAVDPRPVTTKGAENSFNVYASLGTLGLVALNVDLTTSAWFGPNPNPPPATLPEPLVRGRERNFTSTTTNQDGTGSTLAAEVRIVRGHATGLLGGLALKPSYQTARAFDIALSTSHPRPANPAFCTVSNWPASQATKDLAFVAAGINGVYIVDVSDPLFPKELGQLEMAEGQIGGPVPGALAVTFDERRRHLYVTDAVGGLKVFDVSDPCGATPNGSNSSPDDPRLIASYAAGVIPGSFFNSPITIDAETGLFFISGNGIEFPNSSGSGSHTANGYNAVAGIPPLYAVSDTDLNGELEDVTQVIPLGVPNARKPANSVSTPYPSDHFRVVAFLPGGRPVDKTITVDVLSTTASGAELPPSAFNSLSLVTLPTTAIRNLVLTRQSDSPEDPGYNRFQSDPIVVLADARAALRYVRTPEENDPSNSNACQNCRLLTEQEAAVIYDGYGTAGAKRYELISGDRIKLRFTEDLKNRLPYLQATASRAAADFEKAAFWISSTRMDLTPSLKQRPVLSGADSLGVALHSGEVVSGAIDHTVAGRQLTFALDRTFSSQILHDGPLGRGWDSGLFERLRPLPGTDVDYYDGSGRRLRFTLAGGAFESPDGVSAELSRAADGFFYLTWPEGTVTVFDDSGKKVALWDRHTSGSSLVDGNRHFFLYDGRDRLSAVIDDVGRRYDFGYDVHGRLSQVTDFDGRTVQYFREPVGYNLTSVFGVDPGSVVSEQPRTSYTWDSAPSSGGDLSPVFRKPSQLMSVSDRGYATRLSYNWDPALPGKASSAQTPDGTTTFAYTASTTKVYDPRLAITEYEFNSAGHVTKVIDAASQTTEMTYTGGMPRVGTAPKNDGLPASVKLPEGQRTEFVYPNLTSPGARKAQFNLGLVTRKAAPVDPQPDLVTKIDYGARNLPTRITDPTNAATTLTRNAAGDVTKIEEPNTGATTIDVDLYGRPATIRDDQGRTETRSYDDLPGASGQVRDVTVAGGTTTVYDRDARGNVIQMTSGGKRVNYTLNALDQVEIETRGNTGAGTAPARTTYRYDGVGQVKERTSLIADGMTPVTTRSTYVYDDLGRLKERTSDAAGTTQYRYNNQGNLKETEDALGNTTRYGYDVRGLLETVTQPAVGMQPSGVTRFTYNRNGTRTSVTNPLLGVTTFVLDGHDRVKGSDDGVTGALERVTLDLAGRVTQRKVYSKNAMGLPDKVYQWTENQYDPAGRLLKEIRKHFVVPDANPSPVTDIVTETRYDSAGRVTQTIDPRGGTTITQYDAAGRARLQRDAAGNDIVTAYDATGNRESVTVREATGPTTFQEYRTRYEYDDQNRIKKVLVDGDPNAPVTRETSYEYDQAGRKIKEIDPDGGEKTWKYDLAGRRIEEKVQLTSGASPTFATTRWAYDTLGNLEKITDTNGNVTTYAYDVENRLVAETRGEPVRTGGPTWTYTYDAAGNRKTLTDPNGSSITFNYDAAGRYTGRTIVKAAGVKGPSSETMTLDLLGRVTAWLSTGSGVDLQGTATHDSLDRILAETLQLGTGPVRTLERAYDPSGNVTSLKYPSGRVFNLGSDALDRLVTVTNAANLPIVTYEDVGGRQTRKIYGNGLVESRTYDAAPWLKTLSVARPSQTDLLAIDYRTRNLRGLKTEIVRSDRAEKDRYTYDAASRITREELALPEPPPAPPAVATPDVDTNYQLDGLLNITQRQRTQAGSTETATSQGNTRNQYTQWAGQPLTYDPNGNLKTYQGQSFEYDADNRLAKATTPAGETLELFYDPNGRKVREKKILAGIPVETDYIQDGNQIVEAFPKDGLTPTLRLVHGRGIDEVAMAEIDPMATGSPLTVYPLQDEMGNVTHLTDASGGVVEKYRYEGYGKFRIFDSAGTSRSNSSYAWNRLFQGREHFGLIEAYDFRARSLWLDLGRFGQEDPAGTVDGQNRYQSLGGKWADTLDPLGLYMVDVHYYAIYYLSRLAGFEPTHAQVIATASQYVDNSALGDPDPRTSTGRDNFLFHQDRIRTLHFSAENWGPVQRKNPYVQAGVKLAVQSRDLIRLGVSLHSFADSFSHESFTYKLDDKNRRTGAWFPPAMGHANTPHGGHYPDLPYTDVSKAMEMARAALDMLRGAFRAHTGRPAPVVDEKQLESDLMAAFSRREDDEHIRAGYWQGLAKVRLGDITPRYDPLKAMEVLGDHALWSRAVQAHVESLRSMIEHGVNPAPGR